MDVNATAIVVIDTNVVLDWLLFCDPSAAALGPAIESGDLRWVATPSMLEEHRRMFSADFALRRGGDPETLESAFRRWANVDETPPSGCALRCTDADDQMFIDLAVAVGATWLLSRDRALLTLAKRAKPLGVQVLTPAAWSAQLSTRL